MIPRQIKANIDRIQHTNLPAWVHRILVPAVFLVAMLMMIDFRARFEYSSDEGIFLMQALLVNDGYELYRDIPNDQTPLLPLVLAGTFKLLGTGIGPARLLILLFSTLLVWAAYETMRIVWDRRTALWSILLLLVSPFFLVLSVTVIVSLPSMALAVLSLYFLVRWHQDGGNLSLMLSGALLALSILTKLVAAFIAPVFAVGIAINALQSFSSSANRRDLFLPGLVWTGSLMVVLLAGIHFLVGFEHIDQLLGVHLQAIDESFYTGREYGINYYFMGAWPVILLAAVGIIVSHMNRNWSMLYLGGWVVGGYILFLFHRPVWSHHQVYITVPAALLGGIGLRQAADYLAETFRGKLLARHMPALIALFAAFFAFARPALPEAFDALRWPPSFRTAGLGVSPETAEAITLVKAYAPETIWMVTDRPMFAFVAGLPVPPELALISEKQLNTGLLAEEQFLDTIQAYEPEQVLLGRFDFPLLENYLKDNYTLILDAGDLELFIRNDISAADPADR